MFFKTTETEKKLSKRIKTVVANKIGYDLDSGEIYKSDAITFCKLIEEDIDGLKKIMSQDWHIGTAIFFAEKAGVEICMTLNLR
jgi:hypothetical protein